VLEGKAMRKEDEPEQPEDIKSDKPKTRGPRKPVVETEQEDSSEDILLGESTLAKLNVSRMVDEVPAASDVPVAKAEDNPAATTAE